MRAFLRAGLSHRASDYPILRLFLVFGINMIAVAAPASVEQRSGTMPVVAPTFVQVPFIENRGQAGDGIAFYRGSGEGESLVTEEAALVWALESDPQSERPAGPCVLRERFPVEPRPEGIGEPRARVNFVRADDPTATFHGVPAYESIALGTSDDGVSYRLELVEGGV